MLELDKLDQASRETVFNFDDSAARGGFPSSQIKGYS